MAFGPKVNEVSKTTSVVGGYLVLAGLISYYSKENLYIRMSMSMSPLFKSLSDRPADAVFSTIAGILFGPLCANLINPYEWFNHDMHTLLTFTLHLSRIIIGIQVFFNGANLPKKYVKTEWLSLFMVLFPIMTFGWLLIGLLIWGIIPDLSYLEALVIAACIVPTDPVLANSICKGQHALLEA
jgi:NhaP-type Na+/H+ or K+/H+ antiporter